MLDGNMSGGWILGEKMFVGWTLDGTMFGGQKLGGNGGWTLFVGWMLDGEIFSGLTFGGEISVGKCWIVQRHGTLLLPLIPTPSPPGPAVHQVLILLSHVVAGLQIRPPPPLGRLWLVPQGWWWHLCYCGQFKVTTFLKCLVLLS